MDLSTLLLAKDMADKSSEEIDRIFQVAADLTQRLSGYAATAAFCGHVRRIFKLDGLTENQAIERLRLAAKVDPPLTVFDAADPKMTAKFQARLDSPESPALTEYALAIVNAVDAFRKITDRESLKLTNNDAVYTLLVKANMAKGLIEDMGRRLKKGGFTLGGSVFS